MLAVAPLERRNFTDSGNFLERIYKGDPRCWTRSALGLLFKSLFPGNSNILKTWLVQETCCGQGRFSTCWNNEYNFDSCCVQQRHRNELYIDPALHLPPTPSIDVLTRSVDSWSIAPRNYSCWSQRWVQVICCKLMTHSICGIGAENGAYDRGLFDRCCGVTIDDVAVKQYPGGCRTRLWLEESNLYFQYKASALPPLRFEDLGGLAKHFYETGDAIPSLLIIVNALLGRRGAALELCAPAAVLAHLLHLERSLYSTNLQLARRRLHQLKQLWADATAATTMTNHSVASPSLEDNDDTTLVQAVHVGFRRVQALIAKIDQEARARSKAGFEAHFLLAFCWPQEKSHLEYLLEKVFVRGLLERSGTLYLYDVCYRLFPGGSEAYDLRNEFELDISGGKRDFDEIDTKYRPVNPLPLLVLRFANRFRRAVLVPFHEEVPMGMISMVMRHMAVHYDRLPDVLFCLHPDMMEHIPGEALQQVLDIISFRRWPSDVHYLSMGHRHLFPISASGRVKGEPSFYCANRAGLPEGYNLSSGRWSAFKGGSHLVRISNRRPWGAYCQWLELAWELLFERPMRFPDDDYGSYDFGQTIVSRHAVRQRPKSFWQRAWRAMCSRSNYQLIPGLRYVSEAVEFVGTPGRKFLDDWSGYHKAMECVFEHLWVVIFNPHAKSWLWPTRLRDPTLPLVFKSVVFQNPAQLQGYQWTPHSSL